MITPIGDMLRRHAAKNNARFHMPGHKGRETFFPAEYSLYDITELGGTDNLYMPEGVIAESQRFYAPFFNAGYMHYLVGGSTTGVISMLLSTGAGKKVIFDRNFHLSAVSGMILAGTVPVFSYGNNIRKIISENTDAAAVYVTYPDYYGYCFDLKSICDAAHGYGMPVIVDGAHSAAFSFSDELPCDCGSCGADAWVMSLHKTLSAPNQSAVICVSKDSLISSEKVKKCINMTQTTSPSFPLLAVMEYSMWEMASNGKEYLSGIVCCVSDCCGEINGITGYRCVDSDERSARDVTKMLIDVSKRGLSGFEAAKKLSMMGIDIEAADENKLLLMCSHKNTRNDLDKLVYALRCIKGDMKNGNVAQNEYREYNITDENFMLTPREAVFCSSEAVSLCDAAGRISAGTAGAYPPGVPVIVPGVRITDEAVKRLLYMNEKGYSLFGCVNSTVEVVK